MEKTVKFRDYQEQTEGDHNNLQAFARQSFDHIVNDAVTKTKRYSGLTVTKTAQAEVNVAAGRFYDSDGAIYVRETPLTQSMISHLAVASQKIVLLSIGGANIDTDLEERNFLVDVETGETEAETVSLTQKRDGVLQFTAGSESADPQVPATPTGHVAVAQILVDTSQVVSITMLTENSVKSTEELHLRANTLEAFKDQTEPRITSIASDVAALANQANAAGSAFDVSQLYRDIARLKEINEIPDEASFYGADRFLDEDESDTEDTLSLGYSAKIEEGLRFPNAAEDVEELDLFSAADPNASLSDGFLLPKYTSVEKLTIGTYHSDVGIYQYGSQSVELVEMSESRRRIRYGEIFSKSESSTWWKSGKYDSVTKTFEKDGETFEVVSVGPGTEYVLDPRAYGGVRVQKTYRLRQIFEDWYSEPYWEYVTTTHSIQGALVAQSFLNANDMWATRLSFYLTVKAAEQSVYLTLCELTNGVPNLTRAVAHVTVPHGNLLEKAWTNVEIPPTFLEAGKRYALVFVSDANHRIGMASGQSFLDGTFFYSTDGAFFQGDLEKDMMLKVWGARFNNPNVAIELDALSLSGGLRWIDIMADMIVPESTELVFEVQPGGSGDWLPLTALGAVDPLASAPSLTRLRARFVGTRDVMPGIKLAGSVVRFGRPALTFKHVSDVISLPGASSEIYVDVLIEYFDDHVEGPPTQPHSLACSLVIDPTGSPSTESADSEVDLVLAQNGNIKRVRRTFAFTPDAATDFAIVIEGATNSAGSTFVVAERVHWGIAD